MSVFNDGVKQDAGNNEVKSLKDHSPKLRLMHASAVEDCSEKNWKSSNLISL